VKQEQGTIKKGTLLFYALCLMLLFLSSAVTAENSSAAEAAPVARVETLAQLGIKACVPRPSVEPPPSIAIGRPAGEYVPDNPGDLPCPEGFVPQPIERWVPKGRPGEGPPPARRASGTREALPLTTASSAYYYAGAYQFVVSPGSSAFYTQHLPWLMPTDAHTLAEMAVQSVDRRQIVEVGWIVDRIGYGDENLHLFVYHWVNGVETCYNGCGWVQASASRFPGMKIKYDGSASQYMIQYRDGNWWIGYQGEWIGYFPGSLWSGIYTSSGLIQWFGELAADPVVTPPLSSIGNYYSGTSGNPLSAQITQISLLDAAGGVQGPATLTFLTTNANSAWYNCRFGSDPNSFWYGGHGGAP
jgi:neprosin-like protein